MATVHINIGSNIGDRHAHIELAVIRIMEVFGNCVRRSDFIESEPWGFSSPNKFLNLGIAVMTEVESPETVLEQLKAVERSINPASHRTADGCYADRAIDIDLIAIDGIVYESKSLTLPHPCMHMRQFVLIPLAQTAPDWRHPILGLTARELLEKL